MRLEISSQNHQAASYEYSNWERDDFTIQLEALIYGRKLSEVYYKVMTLLDYVDLDSHEIENLRQEEDLWVYIVYV